MQHLPVMINEVLSLLDSHPHSRILDGTLGLGGYSLAILQRFPESSVLAIDRDPQAISFALSRLKPYAQRFHALHANFSDIHSFTDYDAYVFDLGVSNMQLTLPERGFSFQNDGPLDMRMNPSSNSITASELLQSSDINTLTRIFREYGEERFAHQIAQAIKRSHSPITTTGQLVNLIRSSLPQPVQRKMGTHPARRVFQALRIYVNDEAVQLQRLLDILPEISQNALIIFVDYHSLEDRIIKHTFRQWQAEGKGKILTRHPLTPSDEEIANNYKARSAKLRAFLRRKD